MGVFLHVLLFPGGDELRCRSRFQAAAADKQFSLDLNRCRWHLYEKGPAVLLNDGAIGADTLAASLSRQLTTPVMRLYIYDGDFWGYELFQQGTVRDRFASRPDYFAAGDPPPQPRGTPRLARLFRVEEARIQNYLLPWPQSVDDLDEEDALYAYTGDFYPMGDEWQLTDFMKALGFNYDLLEPPHKEIQPPHQTVSTPLPPSPPPSRGPVVKDEVLPDALTSLPYALQRLEEVATLIPEGAQSIRDGQYQGAIPLLTAAIQTHPDSAPLYLLRAFCYSQTEGLSSQSRRPDMDRDLTAALALEPDNIMILRARCPTAATRNRYRRHIEDLTRLMALDPEHRDTYQCSRAYRYHWVGDHGAARADLLALLDRGARLTIDLNYLLNEFKL